MRIMRRAELGLRFGAYGIWGESCSESGAILWKIKSPMWGVWTVSSSIWLYGCKNIFSVFFMVIDLGMGWGVLAWGVCFGAVGFSSSLLSRVAW